ncbi:HNH endonuclease [Nonomuraea wenchangensis]
MAVSKRLRHEIFRRDNFTCQSCGAKAPDVKLQPDHVIPVTLGGTDEPSNLQTLCEDCNAGKSATPPTAATVAKVADDAARWSRAMQAAADSMLGETKTRDEARAAFDARWCAWNEGRSPVPRPMGWEMSVDQFLKASLPLPVLLDCVDIAMRARHVKADGLFKYMCAIAWKKVAELQKAARLAVVETTKAVETAQAEDGPEPDDFQDGRYDLASELLEELEAEEQEKYRREAREYGEHPDDPIESEITAAVYAFGQARYDLERLVNTTERLLTFLPDEFVANCKEVAIDDFRAHTGEDPGQVDLLVHTVSEMVQRRNFDRARAYLAELPPEEKDEWIACATTSLGASDDPAHLIRIEIKAAEYAQKNKATGGVLSNLCGGRGDHGAMCPRPVEYHMRLKDCAGCGGECQGHHRVCASHLERLIDGQVASKATGATLVVLEFEEVPPHDPWEVPF